MPKPRTGHSLCLFQEQMFLFGGLLEITHESNETVKFDLATQRWEPVNQMSDGISSGLPSSRILDGVESVQALKKIEPIGDMGHPLKTPTRSRLSNISAT